MSIMSNEYPGGERGDGAEPMGNPVLLKGHPMAAEVRLEVPRGDLVVTGRIPKFQTGFPPVLIWGARTFQWLELRHNVGVYRECFAVALVDVD